MIYVWKPAKPHFYENIQDKVETSTPITLHGWAP